MSREDALFNTQITAPPSPQADHSRSEQQPSKGSGGARTPQSEPNIQELKDRVHKLEAIISRSINSAQSPTKDNSYLSTTNVPKLRGSIDKSRFFGVSHWMNTFDEV
jgi:hypothetical protein